VSGGASLQAQRVVQERGGASLKSKNPDEAISEAINPTLLAPASTGLVAENTRLRPVLPLHARGMRIGLFGGTFDPPHAAHLAASLLALKRLQLDRLWWLVTPGNPLKNTRGLAPIGQRIAAAKALARHPRIEVIGLEAVIRTRYTYDTIVYLRKRAPGVRFVWIMGADNLRSFYRWQNWRGIAQRVPIAVVDRLGPSLYAIGGRAAQALGRYRIPEPAAPVLADRNPPAWVYLHGLKSPLSSTALRAARVAPEPRAAGVETVGTQ
jgi:nicotinate-nucleotide adenylyltransferase